MPRISQEELDYYHSIEEELRVFDSMRPLLHLAVEVKMGIEAAIEENLDLSASEIGDLALERVKQAAIEQAKNELIIEYEQTNRPAIYARVKDEIEATEGDAIFKDVKNRLESDPELARELHESVRKELGAQALSDIRRQLSEEQEEIISREAYRQLDLDKLDVELAIEGHLDLFRDDINELLEAGDTLDLVYVNYAGQQQKIHLKWVKDGRDHEGWVIDCDTSDFMRRDGSSFPVSGDQFVQIGTLQSDLQEGTKIVAPNLLTVGMPVVLTQGTKKNKQADHCVPYTGDAYSYSYSRQSRQPVVLKGIDFKIKDLDFFN